MTTMTTTLTTVSSMRVISLDTSETASWQDVGYRCPRPGFFLGDDGSLASSRILLASPSTSSASSSPAQKLPPSWSLGTLGKLPLELLHQIALELGDMDIRALVALRNCNRATAAAVDSVRAFATVASFPRALGALMLMQMAPVQPAPAAAASSSAPSLSALADCLRTTACASCRDGTYGDYIYLLRPERVCYACFRSKPQYLPVACFAGSPPLPDSKNTAASISISIRVAPGRYGVLARLTQPVDLFDRRQIGADGCPPDAKTPAAAQTKTAGKPRPDPLRYAAVIPGPYWQAPSTNAKSTKIEDGELDAGFSCRACCQTDRASAAHAGWADPLARYTADGLRRHVEDPQFGGRVVRRRDARTGVDVFEHDAPRRGHFPPPAEFGATADLARRYEAVVLVPQRSVVGARF